MAKTGDPNGLNELKEKQLNVAITGEMAATLAEIKKHHHYLGPQIARGLLEAACQFYDKHKWFGFPVRFELDVTKAPAEIAGKVPARGYVQSDGQNLELNDPKPGMAAIEHGIPHVVKSKHSAGSKRDPMRGAGPGS